MGDDMGALAIIVAVSMYAVVVVMFWYGLCCPSKPTDMNGAGQVVTVPISAHSKSNPSAYGWNSSNRSNHHFHNSSADHCIISMDTSGGHPDSSTNNISSPSNCDSVRNGDSGGFSGGYSGSCSGGNSGGCSGGGSTSCD